MRRGVQTLTGVALTLVAALTLTGCSTPAPDEPSSSVWQVTQTLSDGREVVCLVYSVGYKGGLSCDWGSANR